MDRSSKKQSTVAVKQVLGAVAMLNEKNGSTKQDIFYILDSLHGKRVQHHTLQIALRTSLKKGLLSSLNNRYKVRRNKHVESKMVVNKRFDQSKSTKSRVLHSCTRSRMRKNPNNLSGNGNPVRNCECCKFCRVKSKKNNTTKNFEKVDSIPQCRLSNNGIDSDTNSASTHVSEDGFEQEPKRKKTKRSTKEIFTEVDKTANAQKTLSSESFTKKSIKPSTKVKTEENGDKNQAVSEHRDVTEEAETSAGGSTVSKKLPVDSNKCLDQTKRPRYNLRPRASLKPQKLASAPRKESRKRVKPGINKNSTEPDKKSESKSDNNGSDSGSDNNGDNNLYT